MHKIPAAVFNDAAELSKSHLISNIKWMRANNIAENEQRFTLGLLMQHTQSTAYTLAILRVAEEISNLALSLQNVSEAMEVSDENQIAV
jgi:hypothetical protein